MFGKVIIRSIEWLLQPMSDHVAGQWSQFTNALFDNKKAFPGKRTGGLFDQP